MSSERSKENQGKFTGTHMLMVMVAFFGLIIAVNMTLVVLSNKSWTGLVVKNSYVASQDFNKNVEKQRRLVNEGWQGNLNFESGRFEFILRKNETPLSGLEVVGVLRRPVHERDDISIPFRSIGDGRYEGAKQLAAGKWELEITAVTPTNDQFKQMYRFVVPR